MKRHCESIKHSSRARELNEHPKIDSLGTQQTQDQITRAELYFATFVAEHNLPFSLCSVMFSDSNIAAGFSCARTKTAALITHALAPAVNEPLIKADCLI